MAAAKRDPSSKPRPGRSAHAPPVPRATPSATDRPTQETVLLNASVGFQRVLGRVRRPLNERPASDAPREARSYAIAPKVRHGIRSVVVASRLAPIREHRATSARRDPGRRRERRRSRRTPTLPDLPPRTRSRGRRRGRSDPRWRLGHQRLGRLPGGATGSTNGAGTAPRIAVGGGTTGDIGGTDEPTPRPDPATTRWPPAAQRTRPFRRAASNSASRPR